MSLLYYVRKDIFTSVCLIVRSAIIITSISKFGNNDIELTKVLKGLINWNQSITKIRLLRCPIISLELEFQLWLGQFYVDKPPPKHTFLLARVFLTYKLSDVIVNVAWNDLSLWKIVNHWHPHLTFSETWEMWMKVYFLDALNIRKLYILCLASFHVCLVVGLSDGHGHQPITQFWFCSHYENHMDLWKGVWFALIYTVENQIKCSTGRLCQTDLIPFFGEDKYFSWQG